MCLAIPMRVIEIDGHNARCEAKGVERTVSLFMMQHEEVKPDDLVMVHVGYAIQKVTEEDAQETWSLLDDILEHEDRSNA